MRMLLLENEKMYFHGSSVELQSGAILRPRENYADFWKNTSFYNLLEKYRPANCIPHDQCVFMCENLEDLDSAGADMSYVYLVKPLSKVYRYDQGWYSALEMAQEQKLDQEILKNMVESYWTGKINEFGPLWECLCTKAQVVRLIETND